MGFIFRLQLSSSVQSGVSFTDILQIRSIRDDMTRNMLLLSLPLLAIAVTSKSLPLEPLTKFRTLLFCNSLYSGDVLLAPFQGRRIGRRRMAVCARQLTCTIPKHSRCACCVGDVKLFVSHLFATGLHLHRESRRDLWSRVVLRGGNDGCLCSCYG